MCLFLFHLININSSSHTNYCCAADMKELLETLVLFGHMDEARTLHAALKAYTSLLDSTAEPLDDSNCVFVQRKKKEQQQQQQRAEASSSSSSAAAASASSSSSSALSTKRLVPVNVDWDLPLFSSDQ